MLQKIARYLLPALRIQFFLTLLSMPILVWWGLPVSSLSIIGNLVFAPFLTIFLFLSSLIFFLELACLPNIWLIFMLEKITAIWLNINPHNPKNYLLLFPKMTSMLFIITILIASYIMSYLHANKTKQVIALGTLLLTSCAVAKLPIWITRSSITIQYRHKSLKIDYLAGNLTIHDDGVLNYYAGIENWINYTLSPTLIKTFGTIKIQDLYLCKNTKTTNRNLELLKNSLIIGNIHFKN